MMLNKWRILQETARVQQIILLPIDNIKFIIEVKVLRVGTNRYCVQ